TLRTCGPTAPVRYGRRAHRLDGVSTFDRGPSGPVGCWSGYAAPSCADPVPDPELPPEPRPRRRRRRVFVAVPAWLPPPVDCVCGVSVAGELVCPLRVRRRRRRLDGRVSSLPRPSVLSGRELVSSSVVR